MKSYSIANKEEAFDFCNRLMAYVASPKFQPLTVEADFGKKRTLPQNNYYWTVIVDEALGHYGAFPAHLIHDLVSASKADLTKEFVHELFKTMFNHGRSTTKLDTVGKKQYQEAIRHHFLHEYQFNIPEPKED
jgi:hypothetical protein